MDSFSSELLIRTFSYVKPKFFADVAGSCARWYSLLKDEQLWRLFFLQRWGRIPKQFASIKTWRNEYIRRQQMCLTWSNITPQIIALRSPSLEDDNGIEDIVLSLDRRSIFSTSTKGLVIADHSKVRSQSSGTKRRAIYYSQNLFDGARVTATKFGPNNSLALGLENGNLVVYPRVPADSLSSMHFVCKTSTFFDATHWLPVQKIVWTLQSSIIFLCRYADFPTCALFKWKHVRGKEDGSSIELISRHSNISEWCLDLNENIYWEAGGHVYSSVGWSIRLQDASKPLGIPVMIILEEYLLISYKNSAEMWVLDSYHGKVINRFTDRPTNKMVCSPSGSFALRLDKDFSMTRICIAEQGNELEYTNFGDKIITSTILDIAIDDYAIAVICLDRLIFFDLLNLQVLRVIAYPRKLLRTKRRDLDALGCPRSVFRLFSSKGNILIQRGSFGIHFWNFENHVDSLQKHNRIDNQKRRRSLRANISQDLNDDLKAMADTEIEIHERQRLAAEYSISNMSEAEMIQLAQLMSLGETSFIPSQDSHDSEYELQLAMTLSLSLSEPAPPSPPS